MIACAKGKQNNGKKQSSKHGGGGKRKNKVLEEGETTTVKKQRSTDMLDSRTPTRSMSAERNNPRMDITTRLKYDEPRTINFNCNNKLSKLIYVTLQI